MNLDDLIAAGLLIPVNKVARSGVHILVVNDDDGSEQMYRFVPRTKEATA